MGKRRKEIREFSQLKGAYDTSRSKRGGGYARGEFVTGDSALKR